MNDDDDKARATLEAMAAKLKAGDPLMELAAHEITRVFVTPMGEVLVDFVFGKSPDGSAAVGRLAIGSEAARTLKAALVESQSIPDGPTATRDPQAMN